MEFFRRNSLILLAGLAFALLAAYFILTDKAEYTLFPLGLIAIYFALFYMESTFLLVAFLTPLSINIEEFTNFSLGLFVPTEPLLCGLMGLILFYQLRNKLIPPETWKNPIVWAVLFYLFWILVTSITSSNPLVSVKFLLARLWFIIPMLFFGSRVFLKPKNIHTFLLLFSIGMSIAIMYTVVQHASYRFGEKESHWVMWPFFKDHTIYGAAIGMLVPIVFGLYFARKYNPLFQAILLGIIFISLVGLYFSYTRAAWLSVILALGIWALIEFRVKFSVLASIGLATLIYLFFAWDGIQMEMERNKFEHTTENFGERLQSATNVTTDASNLERINRWSCAISMFKERPFFGFGPGTYAFEYARFQRPENLTIISTNFGDGGNAHSEYLGPLAEMGFTGTIAMILIVIAIFYKAITLYYKIPKEDRETRVLLMAMILSLSTYFIHGILNNFLDTDKAAVPVWGMCAAIIAMEIRLKRNQ
ncbi:MAG: O-antigen ligase family protein [Bacteroidota bacterium]